MNEITTLKRLALTDIELPDFNPRQHENARELKDLAASIAEKGVLEPIVVRPKDGKYQVVAGARRLRAGQIAKQSEIPAIVRELTDQEARELAVIENLQRAQVHWLDEAKAFHELLTSGMTAETLAEHVGKPRVYIHQRLALNELIPKLQKLAYEDKITVAVGLLLGRLTPKVQAAIVEELGKYNRLTASEVKDYIDRYVYLDLAQAPFDQNDAALVPAAGSCVACPKRSGASPLLFPELRRHETCTDPVCFESKCRALVARQQEKYPEAIKIALGEVEWRKREPLRKEGVIFEDQGYSDYREKDARWRQSSAGACEFTQDAIVVAGETAHLGEHKLVCTEPKCPVHDSTRGNRRAEKQPGVVNEERARQIEELWQRRTRHACRVALHEAIRQKQMSLIEVARREESSGNTTVPLDALRFAVNQAHHAIRLQQDGAKHLDAVWKLAEEEQTVEPHAGGYRDALDRLIDCADQDTLLRLLIDLPLAEDVAGKFSYGHKVELVATAYGVDIAAATKPVVQAWEEKKRISYAKRDARLAKERAKLEASRKAIARTTSVSPAVDRVEPSEQPSQT
jgi:ParB family transcriptional regulator, chromosome partitioning protein